MIRGELPERQSLVGAVHQVLDALQGGFLVGLGFGCSEGTEHAGNEDEPQSIRLCSFQIIYSL